MFSSELQQLISPVFNDSVLIEILQKHSGHQDVAVVKVNLKDGSITKGDSYSCSVVRFTLEGTAKIKDNEEKQINCAVIVKIMPKNIGRVKSFRTNEFFRNEVVFYNEVWEATLKFQDSKNIKNKFDNVPICYSAYTDGVNDYIALEDLGAQSYGSYKRQNELSYDTIIQIIHLFARFHALSFAFKDQRPEEYERLATKIEEPYFSERVRPWYTNFHKTVIACSRDAIEKELPESYLKKFDAMVEDDLYGRLCKICANSKGKFALVTQGDAWIPNFLVKYGENNESNVKMIDFQLARYCSYATDISLFLFSSNSNDTITKYDSIMFEYHKVFTNFYAELGSDPTTITLNDLKEDMKENSLVGIAMAMEAIPFQQLDDSEAFDLDSIQGDEAVPIENVLIVRPLKDKIVRQRLANMFKNAFDREFI